MTDEEPHSKLRRDEEETKVEADRSKGTSIKYVRTEGEGGV